MRRIYTLITCMVLLISVSLLLTGVVFAAQVKEEKEEMAIEKVQPKKSLLPPGLSMRASVFGGYDSNVNLSPSRKGDAFEEVLISLGYSRALFDKLSFSLNYDLDFLNYNRITDASNLLNHFRVGLHQKFSFLRIGTGYDLAWVYYTHNDDDFIFNKAFAYIGQDINKNIYHQFQFEFGVKEYLKTKAIGLAPGFYQDKERTDRRWSGIYTVDYKINHALAVGLRARFVRNDSNAIYQDFYDYRSYEGAPYLEYRMTGRLMLLTNFSYTRKNYYKRTVTLGPEREHDNLYAARAGAKYKLNPNSSLSLNYVYRDNNSNEDLEEYIEHVISAGWQYKF